MFRAELVIHVTGAGTRLRMPHNKSGSRHDIICRRATQLLLKPRQAGASTHSFQN